MGPGKKGGKALRGHVGKGVGRFKGERNGKE